MLTKKLLYRISRSNNYDTQFFHMNFAILKVIRNIHKLINLLKMNFFSQTSQIIDWLSRNVVEIDAMAHGMDH